MFNGLLLLAALAVLLGLGTVLKIIGTFIAFIFAIPMLLIVGVLTWVFVNARLQSKDKSRADSRQIRY